MKIAKYIGDLIYDYECVVIPGLGGFISTEKSAGVNPNTNQFTPPSKEIHFNVHLKANDGLLISYVARNESISFKIAKQKVDKFVFLCSNALKEGKRINFSKIGFIFQDDQQNIVFKQDKTLNYNADSFGLSSFVSPAIRRPSSEDKIKEVFTKKTSGNSQPKTTEKKRKERRIPAESSVAFEMPARKKPSKVKQQIAFVFVILFAMGSYYVVNNYHSMLYYWDRYQVRMPFLYNNPNDYLAANAGLLPLDKISVSQAGWISSLLDFNDNSIVENQSQEISGTTEIVETDDNRIIATSILDLDKRESDNIEEYSNSDEIVAEVEEETYLIEENNIIAEAEIVEYTKPENVIVSNSVNQFRYFIIAGSFKNERNAIEFVSSLKRQGYAALIADTNSYGMFRVAFMGFSSMAEAEGKLAAVRRESNPQAWILTK